MHGFGARGGAGRERGDELRGVVAGDVSIVVVREGAHGESVVERDRGGGVHGGGGAGEREGSKGARAVARGG